MMRSVLTVLSIAALVYLAACAALYFFQRSLIYFPQPARAGTAAGWMRLATDGADLAVSVAARDGADALVYFGGNAEDVTASLEDLKHAFPEHAIYLLHYRGYGGSSGTPTEEALHKDALALFDKVRASHPNVVVMGRSLGTGVAMRLASIRPASRLVLVTPYDNLEEIAARQFPIFPVRWMLQDKFDSGQHAPGIKVPTLIIIAEHDEVIPRASTDLLHSRFAKGIARAQLIPGAGHNTLSDSAVYVDTLRGFR